MGAQRLRKLAEASSDSCRVQSHKSSLARGKRLCFLFLFCTINSKTFIYIFPRLSVTLSIWLKPFFVLNYIHGDEEVAKSWSCRSVYQLNAWKSCISKPWLLAVVGVLPSARVAFPLPFFLRLILTKAAKIVYDIQKYQY